MAHKKGVGSSKNGRESESKRLGVKILRTSCYCRNIIIDKEVQNPGANVYISKDHTYTQE
jgi:large subunit ribosomal protein L27